MQEALALIRQVLGILGQILGIVTGLQNINQQTAIEHSPYAIETIAANAANTVNNPTYGNNAIHFEHIEIISLLDTIRSAINSIRTSQDGDDTIILPPIPPPAYGGGGTPAEVWAYQLLNPSPSGATADQMLTWAGQYARQAGSAGSVPILGSRWFRFETGLADTLTLPGYFTAPQPDFGDIGASETVLAWLNRTEGQYTPWLYDAYTDTCYSKYPTAQNWQNSIRCTLHYADLHAIRDGYGGGANLEGMIPPVWPGLEAVTLSTSVGLETGVTITEPMDGVLIAITAVRPKDSGYTYDDIKSYVHIGALAFFSDNGDMEAYQPLSFVSQLYTPRTMARAAGVKIMTPPDIVGTAVPWLITATAPPEE